jgi:hypothetical protein
MSNLETVHRRNSDGTVSRLIVTHNKRATRPRVAQTAINVFCQTCEAQPGEPCVNDDVHPPREMNTFHRERWDERNREA